MTNTIQTQGVLSSGKKWLYDGDEVYIYGLNAAGEREWLVPYWGSLTETEQNELSAIGAEMNVLREKAEAYGEAYISAIIAEGEVFQWDGLCRNDFVKALSNANAPAFIVSDGDGKPIPDGDGTLFGIAAETAFMALQEALEDIKG